jgi:hypothetical protein
MAIKAIIPVVFKLFIIVMLFISDAKIGKRCYLAWEDNLFQCRASPIVGRKIPLSVLEIVD